MKDSKIDQLWNVYITVTNQIVQTREMRLRLYVWKIILVSALFCYATRLAPSPGISSITLLTVPLIALLFDFHIRARNKAIRRDREYVAKFMEPLFDEFYQPNTIYQKAYKIFKSPKLQVERDDDIDEGRFFFPEAYHLFISVLESEGHRRLERYSHHIFTGWITIVCLWLAASKPVS